MSGSASKGNRTPLQKSLSRRVSFNEATIAKANGRSKPPAYDEYDDKESQNDSSQRGRHCNSCCAWTSLTLGILVLFILVAGGIYFAFLQSNLPQVRLHHLDIHTIEVVNTSSETLLTADFEVHLNITNKSDKIQLDYSSMIASLSSTGVVFGNVKLEDMHQLPLMTTDVRVRSMVKKATVEEAAAKELQDNAKIHMLVIDVVLRGHIDFFVGGKKLNGFPFTIDCSGIDQPAVDNGLAPKCNARMTPL